MSEEHFIDGASSSYYSTYQSLCNTLEQAAEAIEARKKLGWIGVDLDGTLAYDEPGAWYPDGHIGDPILPMVERVKNWLAKGYEVRILTARASGPRGGGMSPEETIMLIQDWCEKHIGERLEVTCVKDYHMIELWDDRAVTVPKNTGEAAEGCQSRIAD
jgi:hypothetical protein